LSSAVVSLGLTVAPVGVTAVNGVVESWVTCPDPVSIWVLLWDEAPSWSWATTVLAIGGGTWPLRIIIIHCVPTRVEVGGTFPGK